MHSRSRTRFSLVALFVVLVTASSLAGIFAGKARAQGHSAPRSGGPLESSLMVNFPDVVRLQERALSGELLSTRRPSADELFRLQCMLDQLNALWHSTTTELHARMAVVTDALIERGELAPASGEDATLRDEAIGYRIAVHRGVEFRKAFHLGDDAELDGLHQRLLQLTQVADRAIQATFE